MANPGSGAGRSRPAVDHLISALGEHRLAARVAWTLEERHELVHSSRLDPACHCLVSVGGDGTLSSLLNESPTVPLAILPAGTENLAARHFHSPADPAQLAALIAQAQPVTIDLGRACDRRFILMAGFGFDGEVVTRHHQTRISQSGQIKPTGRLAYIPPILRSSFTYPFCRITVEVLDPGQERTLEGTTVFLFNLPLYALGLPFVPGAREDDGLLDLLVFRDPGPFRAVYYLWNVILRRHLKLPGVTHVRVQKARVSAEGRVPVQLDGDPAGELSPEPELAGGPEAKADAWPVEAMPGAVRLFAGPDRPAFDPPLLRLARMSWNR